eukprot:TRINITY_DN14911_c0_g1_i1.p1 TRINITY_DN14911_c0_g1~~TRINITY_DN14911_c0_g1_i1.p1  ORF type:complete len:1014 (-),score=140.30 TRINITY_DN14911_c0_g1_i1:189-3170(-)
MAFPALVRCLFLLHVFDVRAHEGHEGHEDHPGDDEDSEEVHEVHVDWAVPARRLLDTADAGKYPEELEVSFAAAGTTFQLRLTRDRSLLPSTARHVLEHADGSTEEGPMPDPCFYRGQVDGDPAGAVGVATCGGVLSGAVFAHGHLLSLEPMEEEHRGRAEPGFGSMRHRVRRYMGRAGAHMRHSIEDVTNFVSGGKTSRRLLVGAAKKYVEVWVVNDYSRYKAFGEKAGADKLAEHSVKVMAAVTAIYNADPDGGSKFQHQIQVVLVGMRTLTSADPWEDTVKKVGAETDCSSLLDLFNTWGETMMNAGEAVKSDNRVLLSGRDFDGNTVGLAGMSVMCRPSRSGNVNMCGTTDAAVASCAAVVAHEMGHNFGMGHDSQGNACSQSGKIMEAVGDSDPSKIFSSCSVKYIDDFFTNTYTSNGQCLENHPTTVFGDPVCRNGFVEKGEDCDCGQSDCSSKDPCCNGTTCKFAKPEYQCSSLDGPCCENCTIVAKSAKKACRNATGVCDIAETCGGNSSSCPKDVFAYPGLDCTVGGKSGKCMSGECSSLETMCTIDITRDFAGNYDMTPPCAAYNDECGAAICHDAGEASKYACKQNFAVHGKQMTVPDGTPCWFPGHPYGVRNGMCNLGECKQAFSLATVPLCGNGGIDFGEQCDCGKSDDKCCDCATCQLKATSKCSAHEPCCDAGTCQFKAAGTECRAATGECDVAETCSGASGICPADMGKKIGESCTEDGVASTCYGKICTPNLDKQCKLTTDGAKTVGKIALEGGPASDHQCTGLACCVSCTRKGPGPYIVNGKEMQYYWDCQGCGRSTSWTSFQVKDGPVNKIYLGAPDEGSIFADKTKYCKKYELVAVVTSCAWGKFLDESIGQCLNCDSSCNECTGPTNIDCKGKCKFGEKDSRGLCPISADQVKFTKKPDGSAWPTFEVVPPPPTPPPSSPPSPGPPTPGPPTPGSTPSNSSYGASGGLISNAVRYHLSAGLMMSLTAMLAGA